MTRLAALAALVGVGLLTYAAAAVVSAPGDWRALGRMLGRRTAQRTGVSG